MLSKSLLSLAIAASLVGMSGCNVSSTTDNAGATPQIQDDQAAYRASITYPIFDAVNSRLPVGIDLIMAAAGSTDGTANVGNPAGNPVFDALNDLDGGISTLAPIDIAMSASIDPTTVTEAALPSVWLVKLPNAADVAGLNFPDVGGGYNIGTAETPVILSAANYDALDVTHAGALLTSALYTNQADYGAAATVFATENTVLQANYERSVLDIDSGTNNLIRISPTKPLDGKTKYIAIVTNGVTSAAGTAIVPSPDYSSIKASQNLASSSLVAVSAAINGWEGLAMAFVGGATSGALTADNVTISAAFTTVDPKAVLKSMANPAGFNAALAPAVAGGLLNSVVPHEQSYELIQNAGGSTIHQIPVSSLIPAELLAALAAAPKVLVSQGAIELPQYNVALTTNPAGHWAGSTTVGALLDGGTGTLPPSDVDGAKNVTYRFPFAEKQRDVVAPLMMFEPVDATKAAILAAGDADNDATYYNSGCTKPAAGWPVIIFQHGFQSERTASLINATNVAASTCSAVVAMDLPHHGVAANSSRLGLSVDQVNADPTLSPFATAKAAYVAAVDASATILDTLAERHENLFLDSSTAQVLPMSYANATGGSGSLWIRLDNFQRTRDNMRQGVMDLLNLNATLGAIDLDGSGALNGNAAVAADFDTDNISYVGHSLGGIVGTVFIAVNNDTAVQAGNTNLPVVQKAILATSGGHMTKLIENSVGLSSAILAGLAGVDASLVQGNSGLEGYMKVLQATVDSADPMNFIADLAVGGSSTTDVLMTGMYGDLAAGIPSDLVVPISGEGVVVAADTYRLADAATVQADTARNPLTGLKPMVTLLGAENVADAHTKSQLFAKYSEGGHGTFSSAGTDTSATGFDSAAAYTEMLNQSVKFLGAGAILPSAVDASVDVTTVNADVLITGAP